LFRKNTERWAPYRVDGRVIFSDDPRTTQNIPPQPVIDALDEVIDDIGVRCNWPMVTARGATL
jgi:hypothetical protein